MKYKRRVLIPERYAFYGVRKDRDPTFVYEISNGCSVGRSLYEAVIHGLFELVERDSFLMTWYRRLELPEISLRSVSDEELKCLLSKIALLTSSTIRAFDSTLEHGIPSVWVVAQSESTTTALVAAAAGAHLDQEIALKRAAFEVMASMQRIQQGYAAQRSAVLLMLSEPDLVCAMQDHPMVNSLPEAKDRWSFLLDGRSESDAVPIIPRRRFSTWHSADTVADHLAGQLIDIGLDVIIVDQTAPELGSDLKCMKVIVPGLLPMTFGHAYRRLDGLPRLCDSYDLGRRSAPRNGTSIGAYPHPFP
jgi:ribosomal protein S12 methylthiotransferase accessory factor